jgi:hypothetical protein
MAIHRGHDIAGALRIRVRHVLGRGNDTDDVALRLVVAERTVTQRMEQTHDRAGATHVVTHFIHAPRRLHANATAVERQALADDTDVALGTRRFVFEYDQLRRLDTAA